MVLNLHEQKGNGRKLILQLQEQRQVLFLARGRRILHSLRLRQFSQKQACDPHHPSAVLATKYLAEMIATDLQPYSIVEKEGFVCYSKNLEPRYVLSSRHLLSSYAGP